MDNTAVLTIIRPHSSKVVVIFGAYNVIFTVWYWMHRRSAQLLKANSKPSIQKNEVWLPFVCGGWSVSGVLESSSLKQSRFLWSRFGGSQQHFHFGCSQVGLVTVDLSAVKKELSFWRFRCCSKCWREWSEEGESILNASLLHSSIPNIAILPNAGRRKSRARGNQKLNQKGNQTSRSYKRKYVSK